MINVPKEALPLDQPLAVSIVERPVPSPACVHEDCETTGRANVAVVVCCECRAHWVVQILEVA